MDPRSARPPAMVGDSLNGVPYCRLPGFFNPCRRHPALVDTLGQPLICPTTGQQVMQSNQSLTHSLTHPHTHTHICARTRTRRSQLRSALSSGLQVRQQIPRHARLSEVTFKSAKIRLYGVPGLNCDPGTISVLDMLQQAISRLDAQWGQRSRPIS